MTLLEVRGLVTVAGLNKEGWFEDEQSLNTEEVVVLDEDCEISEEGGFLTIRFSECVHDQVDRSLRNFVIDVSKKGKAQSFVRRQHVLRKGVRVEGGSKIDGNGIEIIALDPIRDSTFEEITISQGKGKHVALKIFEKGHNKQPLGVRGFDKDDPGDSRTPRMGNAMEERPAAVGVDVDAEIGMRNEAFIMKIAYGLESDAYQLWARLIRAKYRWESIGTGPVLRSRCSHLWKSICLVWSTVKSNVVWQLSDGRRVKFWTDCCIDNDDLLVDKIIDGQRPCFPDALVAEMIDRSGQWR
ncbi:hypothetical protein V6N12_065934 [Hibiscus sabdariffa]|uniref:Uncharacterized protein n=1 Tax=Hibiscus sabdariffa TaxID=183260 RepID=A0ABR2BF49_9ROSI